MDQNNRIIFALDVGNMDLARQWVSTLKGHVGWFKVGLELFTAVGPDVVKLVKDNDIKCFLDLKLHDIPEHRCRRGQIGSKNRRRHDDDPSLGRQGHDQCGHQGSTGRVPGPWYRQAKDRGGKRPHLIGQGRS